MELKKKRAGLTKEPYSENSKLLGADKSRANLIMKVINEVLLQQKNVSNQATQL